MIDPASLSPLRRPAVSALALPLVILLLWLAASAQAAPNIEVEGLFPDAAVLRIDGERKMLKVGQSFRGVTLLSAYSETATLEYEGEQMVLGLTRRVGTRYEKPEKKTVIIRRDSYLQYLTTATINGRQVQVLVDTGANVVAMNATQARSLGVDVASGRPVKVDTAGGQRKARVVTLEVVDVGGIRVENVRASVVEGRFPTTILLGMSYLQHVDMEEKGGVLSLSRAWE